MLDAAGQLAFARASCRAVGDGSRRLAEVVDAAEHQFQAAALGGADDQVVAFAAAVERLIRPRCGSPARPPPATRPGPSTRPSAPRPAPAAECFARRFSKDSWLASDCPPLMPGARLNSSRLLDAVELPGDLGRVRDQHQRHVLLAARLAAAGRGSAAGGRRRRWPSARRPAAAWAGWPAPGRRPPAAARPPRAWPACGSCGGPGRRGPAGAWPGRDRPAAR